MFDISNKIEQMDLENQKKYISFVDIVAYIRSRSEATDRSICLFLLRKWRTIPRNELREDIYFSRDDFGYFFPCIEEVEGKVGNLFCEIFEYFLEILTEDEADILLNTRDELYLDREYAKAFLREVCGLQVYGFDEFSTPVQNIRWSTSKEMERLSKIDTAADVNIQSNMPASKNTEKPSQKTINKQNEIIAVLAMMYTKTDCSKPFEAAETIIQEWQRNSGKYGKEPSKTALGRYIREGLERLTK